MPSTAQEEHLKEKSFIKNRHVFKKLTDESVLTTLGVIMMLLYRKMAFSEDDYSEMFRSEVLSYLQLAFKCFRRKAYLHLHIISSIIMLVGILGNKHSTENFIFAYGTDSIQSQ